MDDLIEKLYKPLRSTGERIRENINNIPYGTKVGAINLLTLAIIGILLGPKLAIPDRSTALAVYNIARQLPV